MKNVIYDVFNHKKNLSHVLNNDDLVDITQKAKNFGYIYPVVVTNNVINSYLHLTIDKGSSSAENSSTTTLWLIHLLKALKNVIINNYLISDLFYFHANISISSLKLPLRVQLKACITEENKGGPVIKIMLPEEF